MIQAIQGLSRGLAHEHPPSYSHLRRVLASTVLGGGQLMDCFIFNGDAHWGRVSVLSSAHAEHTLLPSTISSRLALDHSSVLGPRDIVLYVCIFPGQPRSFLSVFW